jgi:hypothetical protein
LWEKKKMKFPPNVLPSGAVYLPPDPPNPDTHQEDIINLQYL